MKTVNWSECIEELVAVVEFDNVGIFYYIKRENRLEYVDINGLHWDSQHSIDTLKECRNNYGYTVHIRPEPAPVAFGKLPRAEQMDLINYALDGGKLDAFNNGKWVTLTLGLNFHTGAIYRKAETL